MKTLKLNYLLVLLILFGQLSCESNELSIESHNRSTNSLSSQKVKVTETRFSRFSGSQDDLTLNEKALLLPQSEEQQYEFENNSGKIKTTITSTVNEYQNVDPFTLGIERAVNWKSVNDDGNLSIYDDNGTLLESVPSFGGLTDEDLQQFASYTLFSPSEFDEIKSNLAQIGTLTEINDELFQVEYLLNNVRYKSIFSNNFQREISITKYNANNEVESIKIRLYDMLDDSTARIKSEANEFYKKSIYSDRNMILTTISEYEFFN